MTPLEAYYQKIQEKIISEDPCQEMAMQQLQQVYDCLTTKKRRWLKKEKLCKGFYLWGEIGRGKTYLMDLFYQQLPIPKLRMHFHQFMHEIHAKLTRLQGQADPLHKLAANLALTANILCLDEFLVHDIGDAMLLSQLLHALFQHGIVLATTANTSPDALYREGLQRERFLPAIQQLKQHLTVFHLDSPCDYRLHQNIEKNAVQSPIFIMPTFQVQQLFNALTQGKVTYYQPLSIYGHLISHKGYTDDTIWFDFTPICTIPRSQIDYLAIAKRFSTVLINHVKPIAAHADNQARLFIHLIDVFYDADINLILVSEAKCADLYPKGRFLFEFQRTQSRLIALKKKALILLKKSNNIPFQ